MLSSFYFELQSWIAELGFDDFGLVPADFDPSAFQRCVDALQRGLCDGLDYLVNNPEARRSPRSVLADVQSLVVVALSERRLRDASRDARAALDSAPELQADGPTGAIVGYATCLDYHDVLRGRLKALERRFREHFPNASTRVAVDTAPILEKAAAVRAGLGFFGRNSLVVNRKLGTRFFLGELLLSVPFETLSGVSSSDEYLRELDAARDAQSSNAPIDCVGCRRCVDACPVGALDGERTLDARKCLNFWTIENRGDAPDEIASKLGGRLFGCDACQRVCPWNADAETASPKETPLEAVERLDEATFRKLFKKTPVFRARLDGLRRIAAALKAASENKQE